MTLLGISDLRIRFGKRPVVELDRLEVDRAEIVGLAGESGSGKSMTTLAILGLAETVGAHVEGSIQLDGRELVGLPQRDLRDIRGRRVAMIFQSPAMAGLGSSRVAPAMVKMPMATNSKAAPMRAKSTL